MAARIPVIIHLHGAEFRLFYEKESSVLARFSIRWVFDHAARIVVLSENWQDWAKSVFSGATIEVIYNPVHIPSPVPFEERDGTMLLFLGRLGQRKGTYDLVKAVPALTADYPTLRVKLCGDGEIQEIRTLANGVNISRHVETLGWVNETQRAGILSKAGIFVLPSFNEGLPMSVLEAMAYGIPVVASRVGGIPEAVRDGEDGFLISPGDIQALTDRLRRLLADPSLRHRMGASARARAISLFGATDIVEQWLSLYRKTGIAHVIF
jgi:glycosyltransferase involved in cell wall biosynthesis